MYNSVQSSKANERNEKNIFCHSVLVIAGSHWHSLNSKTQTILIKMRAEILLIISILLLSGSITTSRGSQKNAEDLIQDICDKLFNENLDSDEDQQWETLCTNLFKYQQHHDISSENNIDGE
jgi:hypothetical protein